MRKVELSYERMKSAVWEMLGSYFIFHIYIYIYSKWRSDNAWRSALVTYHLGDTSRD